MKTSRSESNRGFLSKLIVTTTLAFLHIQSNTNSKNKYNFSAILAIIFTFCTFALTASTYYIAPNGNDASVGDITHPFATLNKAWTKVVAGDLVYMRGGNYAFNSIQLLQNKSGTAGNPIKIWAYPAETPVITKGTPFNYIQVYGLPRLVRFYNVSYIHFKGIDISGFTQENSEVWISMQGENVNNCIFENLNIHNNGCGLVISHNSAGNLVLNSDFHHNYDPLADTPYGNADGLQLLYIDGAAIDGTNTVRGCRSWSNSDDGFDAFGNDGYLIYDNCWSWKNGYKEDGITIGGNGCGYKLGYTAVSTLSKRTITNCLAFENRYAGFSQNEAKCVMNIYNNTSYKNGARGFDFWNYSATHLVKNNVAFYDGNSPNFTSYAILDHNTFVISGSTNPAYSVTGADFASLNSVGMDGTRMSNGNLPILTFLHLAAGSDLINTGVNVGIPYNGTSPDLGAFEFTSTTGNLAPQIQNQLFQLNENSPNGTTVGTVVATDPDAGQSLTYSILSGNTNSAFAINASTGKITVTNAATLNYEVTPSFFLIVKVQDNGTGNLSSQATINITLLNVNESPLINNQTFSISENSPYGTSVGSIVASDPDAGQTLTYSIVSGNTNGAFAMYSNTGAIIIATTAMINFEVTPSYALMVKVQDNGTGSLISQATITITLINVNESPLINNQSFSVNENSPNGTAVGIVAASDPDVGQTLIYSIVAGNTNGAFAINASTGSITVALTAMLNFEVTSSFALVVKVQDNGTGNLSSQAAISITLLNVNEQPIISNQTFSVNENSPNGTIVGSVVASDPDAGQSLTYSIVSGNTSGAFVINAATGAISVATVAMLNFEVNPYFVLVVKVQDNGVNSLSKQAFINITLLNVNEPPLISNQTFSVKENSPNGTTVGRIVASDSDAGQSLTYSILSGNTNNTFGIYSSSGVIFVNNYAALNFEAIASFTLVVKVQDNGISNLISQANIIISVLDLYETSASATWQLTTNNSPTAQIGNINAANMTYGNGITNATFNGAYLSTRAFNGSSLDNAFTNNDYLQFNISPTVGYNFILNTISFYRGISGGSMSVSVLYSTDPSFNSYLTAGDITNFNNTTLVQSSFNCMNISIPSGQMLYFRIYGWNAGTYNYLRTKNVVISGITWSASTSSNTAPVMTYFSPENNRSNESSDLINLQHSLKTTLSDDGTSISYIIPKIFPNPATNGILNIEMDNGFSEQFEILIFDLSGKLLLKRNFKQINSISLDLSTYPPGMYVLQINSFNYKFSDKFILK